MRNDKFVVQEKKWHRGRVEMVDCGRYVGQATGRRGMGVGRRW
jgi:hypothetical protein